MGWSGRCKQLVTMAVELGGELMACCCSTNGASEACNKDVPLGLINSFIKMHLVEKVTKVKNIQKRKKTHLSLKQIKVRDGKEAALKIQTRLNVLQPPSFSSYATLSLFFLSSLLFCSQYRLWILIDQFLMKVTCTILTNAI